MLQQTNICKDYCVRRRDDTGQQICLQVPLLSARITLSLCFTGRIYRWSYRAGASLRILNMCLSVLEGSTAPFQGLITHVVLLCVWHPTAAQSTSSQSTPSHTHPVRAEQACVRQSLFPILLMQSLNAVLISGIDRQVCKGNQRRACLCHKTYGDLLPQWILSWLQSCISQDGNAIRLNPLTHQNSKFTCLHPKEMSIFFFQQRECCLLTAHTLPHLPDP